MARAYAELFIVRDEAFKEAYLTRMAARLPDQRNHLSRLPRPARTTRTIATACQVVSPRKLGIPYVVFNGDLNDLRLYSEEQARTQFEALIEQL